MEIITKDHSLNSDAAKADFRISLLSWFDEYRRDLPWRTQPSLYKTVVSEFMLQQTRVTTALPYFERWTERFPDFPALAAAGEEEVLKAWEGLGYYSRARNLHKLAKEIIRWPTIPEDAESWQALPGIGPYMAAAVTSISFGYPEAVSDGNVVRALTRIFSLSETFPDGATAQKRIRPLAQTLLEHSRPGDFNQAMMELGATVCHRQSPLCLTCPVINHCESGKRGDAESFPKISKKRKTTKRIIRCWVESPEGLLLQKSSSANRLTGIYELPGQPENRSFGKSSLMACKKRTIGLVEYEESIHRASAQGFFDGSADNLEWIDWQRLEEVTLSGPHRKWIEELRKAPSE